MGGRPRVNFDLDPTLFERPDLVEKRCTAPAKEQFPKEDLSGGAVSTHLSTYPRMPKVSSRAALASPAAKN